MQIKNCIIAARHWTGRVRVVAAYAVIALALPAHGAGTAPWADWSPLLGDWIGEGGGKPGQGSGGFSFHTDLQGQVLVRRNRAEYPATAGRPASLHEDLMILYRDPSGKTLADYFDNEGHVIHYGCDAAGGKSWTCVTAGSTPAFRLTYTLTAPGAVNITFEISPSGKPEGFKPYVTAVAHRKPEAAK